MEISETNIVTVAEAARRKGVTRQAVNQALQKNIFTIVNFCEKKFILTDEKFDAWFASTPGRKKKTN